MGLGVACADGAALGSAVADGVGDAEAVGVGVGAGAQSGEVRRPSHVRVTAAESPASMRSMRLVGSAGQVVEVHTVSVPEAMTAPRFLGSGFDPGVVNAYAAYAKKHFFDTIDTRAY